MKATSDRSREGRPTFTKAGSASPSSRAGPAGFQPGAPTIDLLPTLCAAAGVTVPAAAQVDGVNLLQHWMENRPVERSGPLLWQLDLYKRLQRHYPKPTPYATEVAMEGKWKLLCNDAEPLELFDLEADLGETNNLLDTHAETVARLARSVQAFLDAPRDSSGFAPKDAAGKSADQRPVQTTTERE